MAYRSRIKYTAAQKAEMWDRWQRGESLNAIARAFDRPSSSIFGKLSTTGGIRPPPRKRSRLSLALSEREEISRGIVSGLSMRAIAAQLGRSPSMISREVKCNGGATHYRSSQADVAAWDRAQRPKSCKLAASPMLRRMVSRKLRSNRLSRHASLKNDGLGKITNTVSIRERPASVEDRAVPGHWEGDLICGSNHSFIATLVERHTRYVETKTVINALIKQRAQVTMGIIQITDLGSWD